MTKRYCNSKEQSEYVESLIQRAANLLSVIYSRIYFPTSSNGLKDIARYLGHSGRMKSKVAMKHYSLVITGKPLESRASKKPC